MSAALLATSALALGLCWALWLPVRLTLPERLAIAGVTAVLAAAWGAWVAVVTVGYEAAALAAPAGLLALAAAPAAAAWRRRERRRGGRQGYDRRVDDRRFGERRFRDRRGDGEGGPPEGSRERRQADRRTGRERRARDRRGGERRTGAAAGGAGAVVEGADPVEAATRAGAARAAEPGEAARVAKPDAVAPRGEEGPSADRARAASRPGSEVRETATAPAPAAAAPSNQPLPRRLRPAWLLATGLPSALLVWLLATHLLPPHEGGWGSAGSTWGDLALHAALAARTSQQAGFEWESPLVAGAPLTYPFLPDFLSGVLHRWGWSLRWGLLGPSVVVALALVQLLFFTGWRAGRSRLAAVAVLALMLLGGSPVALPALWEAWRESGQPLLAFLSGLRHDATHVPALDLRFSNLVCDALLPQRGMLVGLAAFLAAVPLLRGAWAGRRRLLVPVALLLGVLPFVHVHTFLVLAGVLAWMTAAVWLRPRRLGPVAVLRDGGGGLAAAPAARGAAAAVADPAAPAIRGPLAVRPGWWIGPGWPAARGWLAAFAGGLVLAAPQLAWQLSHALEGPGGGGGAAFSKWRLGWMTPAGGDPILFWARNLGVLLPFLVLAPWLLRRWRGAWLHLCAPLLVLFAIANVYVFQPHDYDNLKLLFYAYLALVLVVARRLAAWWRSPVLAGQLAVGVVLLLGTAGGAVSVLRETTLRWPFLDRDEVALGMELRAATPAAAVFVTADRHNHPVPVVAGRRIVLGYRGWLWTHGIDASRHHRDVAAIYRGDPAAPELLRDYGASYVVVGPHERQAYEVDEAWLAGRYPVALERGDYRVYRVGED